MIEWRRLLISNPTCRYKIWEYFFFAMNPCVYIWYFAIYISYHLSLIVSKSHSARTQKAKHQSCGSGWGLTLGWIPEDLGCWSAWLGLLGSGFARGLACFGWLLQAWLSLSADLTAGPNLRIPGSEGSSKGLGAMLRLVTVLRAGFGREMGMGMAGSCPTLAGLFA